MLKSNSKGQIAQLKVELEAAKKNYIISRPSDGSCNYDIIIDDQNNLIRAQIKYCNRKSSHSKEDIELLLDNKRSKREYYSSLEIDIVLCYVPKIDKVLIFNKEKFHKKKTIYINLKNKKSKYHYSKFIW